MLDRFCHGVPFVLFRQGLFEGEKITPSKALLRRLSQEIGGVERWQGADFACAGMKRKPAPASLENSILHVEQRLRRRVPQTHQDIGIGEFDLAQNEWQADCRFL